jgi:hypothetical protein
MHLIRSTAPVLLGIVLATTAFAGGPLLCHPWVSTPGSLFEALEPLRSKALEADDSPAHKEAALKKLATLRSEIRPNDPLSLMRAGYWATAMSHMKISSATDGPELMERAIALRPGDADYHAMTAIAYFATDKTLFQKHAQSARQLGKPGSAAVRNLPVVSAGQSASTNY